MAHFPSLVLSRRCDSLNSHGTLSLYGSLRPYGTLPACGSLTYYGTLSISLVHYAFVVLFGFLAHSNHVVHS